MKKIDTISINMSINNGEPEDRYQKFTNYCLETRPDLLAIQEVSLDIGHTALQALTKQLGQDYSYHYEYAYPGQEDSQGLAVVTRLKAKSKCDNFGFGKNKMQIVKMFNGDQVITLANNHLEAFPWQEFMRKDKVSAEIDSLEKINPNSPQIIAGDHNSMPWQPCIKAIKKQGFKSVFEEVFGHEPDFTFPAGLTTKELLDGSYLKPKEIKILRYIARLFPKMTKDGLADIPHYVIDYIFVKNCLAANNPQKIGNKPGKLFSDHQGLRVKVLV